MSTLHFIALLQWKPKHKDKYCVLFVKQHKIETGKPCHLILCRFLFIPLNSVSSVLFFLLLNNPKPLLYCPGITHTFKTRLMFIYLYRLCIQGQIQSGVQRHGYNFLSDHMVETETRDLKKSSKKVRIPPFALHAQRHVLSACYSQFLLCPGG